MAALSIISRRSLGLGVPWSLMFKALVLTSRLRATVSSAPLPGAVVRSEEEAAEWAGLRCGLLGMGLECGGSRVACELGSEVMVAASRPEASWCSTPAPGNL